MEKQKAFDVLIRWDTDGSKNVVSSKDLKLQDDKRIQKGSSVQMWWDPEKVYYKGTVEALDEDDSSDEENIPLANIAKRLANENYLRGDTTDSDSDNSDSLPLAQLRSNLNKQIKSNDSVKVNNGEDEISADSPTEYLHDSDDDPDWQPEEERSFINPPTNVHILDAAAVMPLEQHLPESFIVDGEPRENSEQSPAKKKRRTEKAVIRENVKKNRNSGLPYISEKTGKEMAARRQLKPPCSSTECKRKGLSCMLINHEHRSRILNAFFDLGDLFRQRQWISQHITPVMIKQPTSGTKSRTLQYFLPLEDNTNSRVCKVMFLNTLGISERQVRTALSKVNVAGVLEPEKRGGRQSLHKERDEKLHILVKEHISRFPRMESHYCRSNTSNQYLSPYLTVTKMHELYQREHVSDTVSLSFYHKVFRKMGLKFHKPKKDQCGLCESYRNSNDKDKENLHERYTRHVQEKDAVRVLKQEMKSKAEKNSEFLAACFDLQQVLFLPISKRSEVFYKRRLSCYNFTMYNLGSKAGHCYFWHEGQAGRGANEIASCVHQFLAEADKMGIKEVALFSDGCGGQNKNSVIPAMFLHFIQEEARSMKQLTLHYFETSHGQSEGDSMHSTIESAIRRAGDISVPSQLAMVIRMARKNPYDVKEILTSSIQDWKEYSRERRILRIRISEEGHQIDWTKVMQLRISKAVSNAILYKNSHMQNEFYVLPISDARRSSAVSSNQPVRCAYNSNCFPKLSEGKYKDLVSLCQGQTPVIYNPDHISFYNNLPH